MEQLSGRNSAAVGNSRLMEWLELPLKGGHQETIVHVAADGSYVYILIADVLEITAKSCGIADKKLESAVGNADRY